MKAKAAQRKPGRAPLNKKQRIMNNKSPQAVDDRGLTPSCSSGMSRRGFFGDMALLTAAATLARATDLLTSRGWAQAAAATTPDLLHDTFNGLLAFVVPGPDDYAVVQ